MKNPNTGRTIRHAKVLRKAGFVIDKGWMNLRLTRHHPAEPHPAKPSDVDKLVYWKHPALKCMVCIHDFESITLPELVKRVYAQAQYWTKRSATIQFEE